MTRTSFLLPSAAVRRHITTVAVGACLAGSVAAVPGPRPAPDDGETLIRRINAAHRSTWFRTLIFVQRTTFPGTDRPEETWYESMARPGRLRIDAERAGERVATTLFRADSVYQVLPGRPATARPAIHPLLVLLHDLHVGDPDTIVRRLRTLGFDLARTHRGAWSGRPVTVVGAMAGDTTSRQFWVDDERQVVVRVIQPGAGGTVSDTHVGRFTREGDAWVEREIVFHAGGRPVLLEEYVWVRTGVTIPDAVFDPADTTLPEWATGYKRRPTGP